MQYKTFWVHSTCDSIHAIARICHANSVRPSITCVIWTKMAERIIKILSPSDRPIILVFWHVGKLLKSDGFTPNGGAKCKGGSNFQPICIYISETVTDRGIVTMEDEYKVVCALSNSAAFDDIEWPWTPVSRSQYSLKANISQMVYPILSMFGSRQGFSGSVEWHYYHFDKIQDGSGRPSWNDSTVARKPLRQLGFLVEINDRRQF